MNEQFLENKKEFNFTVRQFRPIAARPAQLPAAQPRVPALPRAQAATWAWAGNSASRPIPLGPILARALLAVDPDRAVERTARGIKSPAGRAPRNPRPFLCLLSLSVPRTAAAVATAEDAARRSCSTVAPPGLSFSFSLLPLLLVPAPPKNEQQ